MEQKILIFKFLFFSIFFLLLNTNTLSKNIIYGKGRIVDGDTIHIGQKKIRLHGIDAPENEQGCTYQNKNWNCGLESKKFLLNLTANKTISCESSGKDKYKRYIAICFIDNLNINKIMVKTGWAIAYRYYSTDYINEENFAQKNKLGIWRGEFEEPYIFRKKNK